MSLKNLIVAPCPGGDHHVKPEKGSGFSEIVCQNCGTKLHRKFKFDALKFFIIMGVTFFAVFVVLVILAVVTGRPGPTMAMLLGIAVGAGLVACWQLEKAPQ